MNIAVAPVKHAAPGPYLGFALQPVRLCFHLLTCPPNAHVSLEYLDDVAIHLADGSLILEQTKSALKQNPLSDWSDELWKAFANWLKALGGGKLASGKTQFRLYVTPVRTGAWAQALNDAETDADADAVYATIHAKHAALKKPKGCEDNLRYFLEAPPALRREVIRNFRLVSADEDPIEPIRRLLQAAVAPEAINQLCGAAIGIAKDQAERLMRQQQPPLVDADKFRTTFIAFVRRINIPGLLASISSAPPDSEVHALLAARPKFIRQLEIIDAPQDDRLRAVSDFLRTSADKTAWADQGLVYEGSLAEWDDFLVSRHGLISGEVEDLHQGKDAKLRGRMTYRQCAQVQAPLEGRAVPGHFVHGSFNELADSLKLGWHPDYKTIIAEDS